MNASHNFILFLIFVGCMACIVLTGGCETVHSDDINWEWPKR